MARVPPLPVPPLTVLALGALALATPAAAQPSPYAGADRYGPAPTGALPAPAAVPSAAAYLQASPAAAPAMRSRVLTWPGKVALRSPPPASPPTGAQAAAPYPAPDYAPRTPGRGGPWPVAYAQPVPPPSWRPTQAQAAAAPSVRAPYAGTPAQAYAQPSAYRPATAVAAANGWRPVFAPTSGLQGAPVQRSATPAVYVAPDGYSPALAAAHAGPPNRALAADRRYGYDPTQDHSVRFYSVSRPFGLRPDPAPIPPQFFTATADLGADPPGPLPVNHTTAATRAAVVGGDSGGQ